MGFRRRSPSGGVPWAIWLYPVSFRERYGPELEALVEDMSPNRLLISDLVLGAAKAWLRPVLPREVGDQRRRRLQASVATNWVAWCAGFLVAPATSWNLLDERGANVTSLAAGLTDAAQVGFYLGALLLLAYVPLALRTLAVVLRDRDWKVVRPVLPGLAMLAVEVALFGLILLGRHFSHDWLHRPPLFLVGLVLAWVLGGIVTVAMLGLGPALALGRARPTVERLRLPVVFGAAASAVLTGMTACSLAATVIAHQPSWFGSIALGVASVASLVGLTSSYRGLRALATA
jgi:MFS family permease